MALAILGETVEKDEIERKFLPKFIPDEINAGIEKGRFRRILINQGYVSGDEGFRLRKENEKGKCRYFIATKRGEGLKRGEKEVEIKLGEFALEWERVTDQLWKMRYFIPHGRYMIELNFFFGPLKGYVQIEEEFASEKEAVIFVPPRWFDKEVTDDESHSNFNLARLGVPKEEA